jgi:hypothetical protein
VHDLHRYPEVVSLECYSPSILPHDRRVQAFVRNSLLADQPFPAFKSMKSLVLLRVGEIAVPDAWKERCRQMGNLNVEELVHHATAIQGCAEDHMSVQKERFSLPDAFNANSFQQSAQLSSQSSLVTYVWHDAALLYLQVVVSDWQPTSVTVRFLVRQLIEVFTRIMSPSALLHTVVWPPCVASCFADPR